jgi:uncharacterized protein
MQAPQPVQPAPAALYAGPVMHARLRALPGARATHRFQYRVLSLLIDLDRLEEADRLSPLLAVNRRALFSFHESDHGPRDGTPLRIHAGRLAAAAGIDLADGRVRLLCYPRVLGYVFNPLSVYYCEDRNGRLVLLIYEVRNTFGGIHSYICPVTPSQTSSAGIRQEQAKTFYVSPFVGMAMRYHFRMTPPDEDVKIRILETDLEGPVLAATFHGRRRPLNTGTLLKAFCAFPLVTLKIVAAIHLEAARLWLKGARLVPRPTLAAAHGPSGQTKSPRR